MIKSIGKKKLLRILRDQELSPHLKLEIKHIISKYNISKKEIIDIVHEAIDFWDDLREYNNSAILESYFLKNVISDDFNNDKIREKTYQDYLQTDEYSSIEDEKKINPKQNVQQNNKNDQNDFFFDDDVEYKGLFKTKNPHGIKDHLVLGEDEYDKKRNRCLFKVCLMLALPLCITFFLGIDLMLERFDFALPKIWLLSSTLVFSVVTGILFYTILGPRDLTWPYDRVITWSYSLNTVYLCAFLMFLAIHIYIHKDSDYKKDNRFYFRTDTFEIFVSKNPENAEGHMKLAYAHMSNDNYESALSEVNMALNLDSSLDPANDLKNAIIGTFMINREAVIKFSNGMMYWFIKQNKAALSEFQESIKLYPKFATVHYYMAYIYFSERNYEKAWEHALEAQNAQYPKAKSLLMELQKYFSLPPI